MTKVQRYKVGYYSDEWGMSSNTPCLIPDDSGYAVEFEDYCKLETELAAIKEENEGLKRDAERYRFIKDTPWCKSVAEAICHHQNSAWDNVIDAAMAQGDK